MTLIDRLSKLDGPCAHFQSHEMACEFINAHPPLGEYEWALFAQALQGSVNSAISLVESVLPNERVQLNRIAFDSKCQWRASLTGKHTSWSPSPAIALCIAILRAKEASSHGQ